MSDDRTPNMPHDVPSVEQIVQAVREWIERDLVPATTGRIQFHGRVAANMLGIHLETANAIGLGPIIDLSEDPQMFEQGEVAGSLDPVVVNHHDSLARIADA